MLVALFLLAFSVVAIAGLLLLIISPDSSSVYSDWIGHSTVMFACVPLAVVLCFAVLAEAEELVKLARAGESKGVLFGVYLRLAKAVPEIEKDMTLLDVQLATCLLFVGYACMRVWRHLVDIVRLLKVSRRRMLKKEIEAEKRWMKEMETKNLQKAK